MTVELVTVLYTKINLFNSMLEYVNKIANYIYTLELVTVLYTKVNLFNYMQEFVRLGIVVKRKTDVTLFF